MKKNLLAAGIGAGGIFVAAILSQVAPPAPQRLSEFVPAGPVLYLEARDFAALLSRWSGSPEQQRWLRSANHSAFAQSHLFLRLTEAYKEYAGAAGIPQDTPLLQSVAGAESSLALYDIGKLEFLYLTRLTTAKAVETVVWRSRANFTPRKAGGVDFYIRTDPSGRVVAFAAANDVLLLATREDLIAGALELMARETRNKMIDESWFVRPSQAATGPGDLRLVMDFTALGKSSHFRSHWSQHNVSLVRQYTSGISDLFLDSGAIREERLLLRAVPSPMESAADRQALAEALRLVPEDAGFYRGWASPEPGEVLALLTAKLLDPAVAQPERPANMAPPVPSAAGAVGSEGDLDTRIDEPELTDGVGRLFPEVLKTLLNADNRTAVAQVEETRLAADAVFIGTNRALVVARQSAWDAAAVREAIRSAIENMWTTSRLGAGWTEMNRGNVRYFALDGLVPLAVAVEGNRMIVANSQTLIERMLSRTNAPTPTNIGIYAAGFRHERERRNFAVWMQQLDNVRAPAKPSGAAPPEFLSHNLVSLSDTLSRVRSATIGATRQGEVMKQTVTYELAP
jgi:hypothetical protein